MPSEFDPYYFFLGIPPKERPLDHYLLLGVERFEENAQIIEMAADRQMGHLQRYESGEHGDQVAKLMSKVSRARLCLLNSKKKAAYDEQLRAKLDPPKAPPEPEKAAKSIKLPPPLPKIPADPSSKSIPIDVELVSHVGSSQAPQDPEQRVLDAEIIETNPASPQTQPGARRRKIAVNSIGMQFVLIPAGQFVMGSPITEPERGNNEFMHPVTIGLPLLLGVHPVTQAQYQKVMGLNPSSFSLTGLAQSEVVGMDTRNFPVEWISWLDAVEFCHRLSALREERAAGRVYRLPSEAEWESAAALRRQRFSPLATL